MNLSEVSRLLEIMQEHACVSGKESDLSLFLEQYSHCRLKRDEFGNLFAVIKGHGQERRSILMEAHLDEIGFVISDITPSGFLICKTVGGFCEEILPGSKVTVFGKKTFHAVIGSKPPHLSRIKDSDGASRDICMTAGFSDRKEAEEWVGIGDIAHFYGPVERMENGYILSRGLDNKVGVLALLDVLDRLKDPFHDVVILLSLGEETTSFGVSTFTNERTFDLALVVDAGFGKANGVDPTRSIDLGGGPSVSITEREHVGIERRVIRIAEKHSLPCQVIAEPGGTGTNSRIIQIRHGGIPTAVISVPILNMHTSSEIADAGDISRTTDLLIAVANEAELSEGKAVQYV